MWRYSSHAASAGACWTGEDCRTPFVGADGVERPPLCRALGPDGRLTLEAGVDLAAVDLAAGARPLAQVNDARVEALATADTVSAQVMQFEDGAPTIIMVEEL
jgi:hypothetical protein